MQFYDYSKYVTFSQCRLYGLKLDSDYIKVFFRNFKKFLNAEKNSRNQRISPKIIGFSKIRWNLANFQNFVNFQCALKSVDEGWRWRHKIFELQIYFYSPPQIFMKISHHDRFMTKNRWGGESYCFSPPEGRKCRL